MYQVKLMVLLSILSFTASSAWGQDAAQNSYGQFVILMMDEPVMEFDQSLLASTLDRSPLERFAKEILGADYAVQKLNLVADVHAGQRRGMQQRAYVSFTCSRDIPKSRMHEIWRALVSDFSNRLSESVARIDEHRLLGRQRQIERLRKIADEAESRVESGLRLMRDLEKDESPLTSDQLRERIQQTSERIHELKMKRIAWDARREATEKQVAHMRVEADEKSQENPVLRELERLVTLKDQQLAMTEKAFANGKLTSRDVAQAAAAVTEAKIKLLEQKQQQVDPGLSSQISTLNVRLADGMIEMVEARILQDELKKQLVEDKDQLTKKLYRSTGREIAQIRLESAKRRLAITTRELDELEAESPEPARITIVPWVE